ncbi:MAG: hypothetical protein JXR52_13265 [Bacteroidales bacterium]|nr:hypothetical protein [Bacteroidales bacterium]
MPEKITVLWSISRKQAGTNCACFDRGALPPAIPLSGLQIQLLSREGVFSKNLGQCAKPPTVLLMLRAAGEPFLTPLKRQYTLHT